MNRAFKKSVLAILIAIIALVIVLVLLSTLSSRQAWLKEFSENLNDAEAAVLDHAKAAANFKIDPRTAPDKLVAKEAEAQKMVFQFGSLHLDLINARDRVWAIKSEISHGYKDDYAIRDTTWMSKYVFRALPSETTLCIVLIFCGVLGAALARLRRTYNELITSIPLGMGAGLIIFLLMKGGEIIFFLKGFSESSQINQYSFALLALLSGFYSDQFFTALSLAYGKLFKKSP